MKNRAETSGIEQKSAPPAGGQGFVRLEGVSKRFGDVVALHEATLDVRRGEILTLLGPSGGGKTTLLNLVAGFLLPDSGAIHIAGQPVTEVPPYRREIGVLFQNYALFPHMSVAANVAYGLRMRRQPRPEIARKVAQTLALVRLVGLEDRRPRQLSGGQQQRVALARALAISPKVLLLDEPFSALDKNLRGSMQLELKEIQRKLGVTTVFVTRPDSRVNIFEVMAAWFDRDKAVVPYEAVYSPDQSREDVELEGAVQMASSQDVAVAVAMQRLGYEVPSAVEVLLVSDGMPADGALERGDVIVAVGDKGRGSSATNVSLMVDDVKAAKLAFASDNGKVWLALRRSAGAKAVPPGVVTIETVLLGVPPVQVLRSVGGRP